MRLEYKTVGVASVQKVEDEGDGVVTAFVSVTGLKDNVNDIIEPGAYAETLGKRVPKGVWGHQWIQPTSKTLEAVELMPGDSRLPATLANDEPWPAEAGALRIKTRFNLKTQRGRDAYEDVIFFDDEQEWCVDAQTEILTERGWLRYDELTTDDRCYGLDMEAGIAQFEQVGAVNIWPRRSRTMRLIETGGFSSLTTAAHRWPVRFDDGHVGWRTTAELKPGHAFFRAAPRGDVPDQPKWSDSFVELVAWYWTEGWKERTNMCIGQSAVKNAGHAAAIQLALCRAFPGGYSVAMIGEMLRFRLSKQAADVMRTVLGEDKAPTPTFLLSLTAAQLELFIARCMDGDGHRTAAGQRTWYQVSWHSARIFEMACALAGIATVTHAPKDYGNRWGTVPKNIALLRSTFAKPLDSIRVKTYDAKPRRTKAVDAWIDHEGIVWCPSTASGTWLARRNGAVYFTGNSIGYVVPSGGAVVDKKTGVRRIKRLDLYEYSPVLFGAMPMARTSSVKAAQLALKTLLGEDVARWERQFAELKDRVELADGDPANDDGGEFDGDGDVVEPDPAHEPDDARADVKAVADRKAYGSLDPDIVRAAIKALESVLTGQGMRSDALDADLDDAGEDPSAEIEAKAAEHPTVKAAVDALDLILGRPDVLGLRSAASAIDGAYHAGDLAGVEAAGTDILDALERVIDHQGITDEIRVVSRMIADRIEDLETGDNEGSTVEAEQDEAAPVKDGSDRGQTGTKNYGTGGHASKRPADELARLGKRGMAFRNGKGEWCYPVETVDDLTNAVQAFGRSKPEDRDRLRAYVKKRARALRREDLLPDAWSGKTQVLDLAELKALETFAAGLQPPQP